MTQARTLTHGLVTPPPIELLLEAALCVLVSLVQGVATTLGMRFNRIHRDWRTMDAREALPQAKPDTSQEGLQTSQPSFSGKAEGRIPGNPVGSTLGPANHPHGASTQDARHKAEHDSVGLASTGATLSPSFRAKARSAADPEPSGHTRRHHTQLLASVSRIPRDRNDKARVLNRVLSLSPT